MCRSVPLAQDDRWDSYADTVVEIVRGGEGDMLTVRPAPPGQIGDWPWPDDEPVVVLTAWDPGAERPGTKVNRRRQQELDSLLRPMARELCHAVGEDPGSGHREEGVAVLGVAVNEARAVGARFGQEAIFVWTRDQWAIVSCASERRQALGWTVTVLRPM
jgi:hypothetical protein